ncbi:LamG domain-containing protein [Lysobacter soli]|uniref:LamG domain-containing protein n=1 Tax=Lysobacter soli TaxID=453783 RepID=UPI0037C88B86
MSLLTHQGLMMAGGGGGGGTDQYFAQVSALLHFDGVDGSTTFTDETGQMWAAGGPAALDNAVAKFGTASLLPGASGYITTPNDPGFVLGNGEWTMEAWVDATGLGWGGGGGAGEKCIACLWNSSGGNSWFFGVNNTSRLFFYWNGSFFPFSTASVPSSGWVHVAAVRHGNNLRLFINGTESTISGGSTFSGAITDSTANLVIGGEPVANNGYFGARHLDDFRLTKGVARYTANFSPPNAPFPNS